MGGVELLEVGAFPALAYQAKPEVKEASDHFMEVLRAAGSEAKWYDDVQEKRWNKLLLNAPWNPICALTLSREVAFLVSSPAAEKLILDVMLEVVAVSQALGYTSVTAEEAKKQVEFVKGRIGSKGIEPSM
jgi:2-dehydropantoate 2-reductase